MEVSQEANIGRILADAFGSYRAENLSKVKLAELYTAPSYFPELLKAIPCFLEGGRGTGKTTVLKHLSYEFKSTGQAESPFHGLYHKFETSEVNAFQGIDCSEAFWKKAFAHYLNLRMCTLLVSYTLEIFSEEASQIDSQSFRLFLYSFRLSESTTLQELPFALEKLILSLQNSLNDLDDVSTEGFSMLASPQKYLIKSFQTISGFSDKPVAFLFDEYENLENYQQQIVNTLIKQADHTITFKVGVREEGLRERRTIGNREVIQTPADYALIKITDKLEGKTFDAFAKTVINSRLSILVDSGYLVPSDIASILPGLSVEDEAKLLDVSDISSKIKKEHSFIDSGTFSDFEIYLLDFIATSRKIPLSTIYADALKGHLSLSNLKNNYGYASLFALKRKSPGQTKYYCGWDTFLLLADGNIRYLLQLISKMLSSSAQVGNSLSSIISFRMQSQCASKVAEEILQDSEGISRSGTRLMKLVLALGTIFHQLAINPEGHAPELNQFEIINENSMTSERQAEIDHLLREAVMHMALVRSGGTKLSSNETRSYDYMLHPIYAPYFVFSHRRKRKFKLEGEELLSLIENHKETISLVLKRHNRYVPSDGVSQPVLDMYEGLFGSDEG